MRSYEPELDASFIIISATKLAAVVARVPTPPPQRQDCAATSAIAALPCPLSSRGHYDRCRCAVTFTLVVPSLVLLCYPARA